MLKYLPAATICFSLTGCFVAKPAQPVATDTPGNNQQYTVDYLFEHEGCKVYRFYDRGNYVYFTNCSNQAITMTDSTRTVNMMVKQR